MAELIQLNKEYLLFIPFIMFLAMFLKGYSVRKVFKFPFWFVYIGSDIGGNKNPYYIKKQGIQGAPDAVFFDLLRLSFVVGEYKSRNFNGRFKHRENYQVILYTGLLPPWYWPRCKGYIAFGCGEVKKIAFNRSTYRKLLKMRGEVECAKKQWSPMNAKPLHKR